MTPPDVVNTASDRAGLAQDCWINAAAIGAHLAGQAERVIADAATLIADRALAIAIVVVAALGAELACGTAQPTLSGAVIQRGTAERRVEADAIAALLTPAIAAGVVACPFIAGKLEGRAAFARCVMALAGGTAGDASAAIIFLGAASAIAAEKPGFTIGIDAAGYWLSYDRLDPRNGRTPQGGAAQKSLEDGASGDTGGKGTGQCIEAPVVHDGCLLARRFVATDVTPDP